MLFPFQCQKEKNIVFEQVLWLAASHNPFLVLELRRNAKRRSAKNVQLCIDVTVYKNFSSKRYYTAVARGLTRLTALNVIIRVPLSSLIKPRAEGPIGLYSVTPLYQEYASAHELVW